MDAESNYRLNMITGTPPPRCAERVGRLLGQTRQAVNGTISAQSVKIGEKRMADITYCMNINCPLENCPWHLCNAKTEMVSIAAYDDTCKRYHKYLLEVMGNG